MLNKWLAAVITVIFLVSGCSSNKPVIDKKDQETAEEKPNTSTQEKEPAFLYPLTGIRTPVKSENRSVAVVVNNHPKARPQSGLDKADIVYELLAEGEVTRFLAIYQSERPEKMGPVRSARDYYIELAKGYDSLFIAHGYSPEAKKLLKNGYIDNINGIDYDGTLFKRSSDRKAPHNSYITFDNILSGAEQKRYNMKDTPSELTFLSEKEAEAIEGEDAESVLVSYFSNPQFDAIYEFDKENGRYKRYSNGELTADADTSQPVLIDNLFIVEADHKVVDNSGRRDINLTSGGRGYLIQKGKWRKTEWKNINGKILPTNNGKELGLISGRTWISVIPANPGLEQSIFFNAKQ